MAVIVSEVLGVPVDEMRVTWANTDRDAWTFVTDASRSCHCDGKAAYNAAQGLRATTPGARRAAARCSPRPSSKYGPAWSVGAARAAAWTFGPLPVWQSHAPSSAPIWEPLDQNPYAGPGHRKDGSQA